MNILVLHGPNINLIGKFSSNNITRDKIDKALRKSAHQMGHDLVIFHFIEESKYVRQIQRRRKNIDGIIFNPGALCNSCFVIKELLQIIDLPFIEIHISDIPDSKANFDSSILQSIATDRIFNEPIPAYQ